MEEKSSTKTVNSFSVLLYAKKTHINNTMNKMHINQFYSQTPAILMLYENHFKKRMPFTVALIEFDSTCLK